MKVIFKYPDDSTLTIEGVTLKEIVCTVVSSPHLKNKTPLKMEVPSTGKMFYFSKSIFTAFLNDEIELTELAENTECEELYRNIEELEYQDEIIDQYSLWMLRKGKMIIINRDSIIETTFDPILFFKA